MNKKTLSVMLLVSVAALISCKRNEAPASGSRGTGSAPKGRAETRVVEALDAVGYEADKVRKSVDRALDAADEKIQQTQDLLEE